MLGTVTLSAVLMIIPVLGQIHYGQTYWATYALHSQEHHGSPCHEASGT